MFYEDVVITLGDTIARLGSDYGYRSHDWNFVWQDQKNTSLRAKRNAPINVQPGDVLSIPIPWRVVKKHLTPESDGADIVLERDGGLGRQLSWVQTVYRHNQPVGPNPSPFCVDGCVPDDNLPFYWTDAEVLQNPERRRQFHDYSSRDRPSVAMGTTKWRAVVSLAVVTKKRVTIWNSLVWGWNMTPTGMVTGIGPRAASETECFGHLNLLRNGVGTGPLTFGKAGWTFRSPPPTIWN